MNARFYRRPNGFTLIELMVAVVVIAILTAVALPSYQNHVRKARRVECEGVLLRSASVAERRNSATMSYIYAGPAEKDALADLYCPKGDDITANTKFYDVTYQAEKAGFLLTATPLGDQRYDKCGTLTLDHLGKKEATGGDDCW